MKIKFNSFSYRSVTLCFLLLILSCSLAYGSFWERRLRNFEFFPQYHTEVDLRTFMLQKSDYFKTRYFLEANTTFEFILFKYRKKLHFLFELQLQTGMGKTPGSVVFDPMDINYGLLPAFEYRLPKLNLQTGIEHNCFHEIDRQDMQTVYFNKVFLAAGSKNMRSIDYRSNLLEDNSWTFTNRFSWYTYYGYYVKNFFGLIDPANLNGYNYNNQEILTDFRYAFHQRNSWIMNLRCKIKMGLWDAAADGQTSTKGFWRVDLGIEYNSKRGNNGAMFFINYTLDDVPLIENVPRFSNDQMLQIGVRLYS